MNNVENAISQLEKQRSAIDRALSALREVTGAAAASSAGNGIPQGKRKKRHLSPEGRQRIIEAIRRRWAAQRAGQPASKKAAGSSRMRRGKLSEEGRKRLVLAMKKRWAAAKKAGKQRLA